MKYYLVKAEYGTKAKNKLQKAVYDALIKNNRELIPEQMLESFKAEILTEVHRINAMFKNCTPEKPDWYCPYIRENNKPQDWSLSGCHFIDFTLLQSKNQETL